MLYHICNRLYYIDERATRLELILQTWKDCVLTIKHYARLFLVSHFIAIYVPKNAPNTAGINKHKLSTIVTNETVDKKYIVEDKTEALKAFP